ncbi:MAG: hypothetical protein COB65_13820 [Thalassobium sp.]|nr:MAG: hypothetical protein COB65_13820 [Thalassobium sp.]
MEEQKTMETITIEIQEFENHKIDFEELTKLIDKGFGKNGVFEKLRDGTLFLKFRGHGYCY